MRLNQVTVPVKDIEKSTDFYLKLGLKLIVKTESYCRFEVGDGTSTLSIHKVNITDGAENGPHLYLECDDLDSFVTSLKEEGFIFDSDPIDQSWLWREAWLADPNGVKICLYHAGDMRRYPPWRLP